MLYYFFFIICLIVIINAVVQNEDDIINNLSKNVNEIILDINSKIDITKEITINNSIKKLSFFGNPLEHSELKLNFPLNFESNLEKIEIKNININGTLVFNNNKEIIFNTVNLNGYINSNFDKKNAAKINISKLTYRPTGDVIRNCINLSGDVTINNSYFYGDSSCQNRLIHFNGLNKYTFELKESFFNGNHLCPFLSIENALKANIESSSFEKGYSSENIDGGGALISTYSSVTVKDCIFNDILSYNSGGAFNLYNNKQVKGSNLYFDRVTSLAMGSIFQISSEFKSELFFYNITQKNTGGLDNMRGGGLIMNIEHQADVEIDLYHAENLTNKISSGAAFVLSEYSKLKVSNIYIDTLIGHGDLEGLFYTAHDSFGVVFKASNVELNNLYQLSMSETSIIYAEKNNNVTLEGVKIFNSGGYNTNLINQLDNARVIIDDVKVDNFNSTTVKEFINYSQEPDSKADLDYSHFGSLDYSQFGSMGYSQNRKRGYSQSGNIGYSKIGSRQFGNGNMDFSSIDFSSMGYMMDCSYVPVGKYVDYTQFNGMEMNFTQFYGNENIAETAEKINVFLVVNNFKVSNIISQGVLFKIKNGNVYINNSEFRNIHACYKHNNCNNIGNDNSFIQDTAFLYAYGENDVLTVSNITISNMNGDVGIATFYISTITISFVDVNHSYFKKGFIYMNEKEQHSGTITVMNSDFTDNTSEYGTIINMPYMYEKSSSKISISSSYIANNSASKFGGVFYSTGEFNSDHLFITCNKFYNNYAKLGNIIYGHSKNKIPTIDEIKTSDIVLLPSNFKLNNTSFRSISILSGEKIPENIIVHLYDGNGKKMYFPCETDNIQLEDLAFFNVEINDPSNAVVIGQTHDYCWDDKCIFPSVKVVGNPGTYYLSLNFLTFGPYPDFLSKSFSIEVEIMECNSKKYHYQPYEHSTLRSCYIPICHNSCNNHEGECINHDVCDCRQSNFIGKYCDEREMLGRYRALDIIVIIISGIIINFLIVLIGFTLHYKNHSVIKGGGVEFLIIILIGLILNSVNTILLTYNKTTYLCYQLYLFSNTGFSLVFGSVFVKTLRINRIFNRGTRYKAGFRKRDMFLTIVIITLFHWIMALVWLIFKKVSVGDYHTGKEKLFKRCEYPISKNFSIIFNFIILMWEFVLSYSIRKVEKTFKEYLVVPAYVYIMYKILVNVINFFDINIIIQDYFDIVGNIISTLVIIYFLFIVKFIEINDKRRTVIPSHHGKVFKIESSRVDSIYYSTTVDFVENEKIPL